MSIFLMGVYDPATYQWCTVTKCGIGFDDKTLEQLQKDIKVNKISKVCRLLSDHKMTVSGAVAQWVEL